jgi:hypothetical protein
MFELVKITRINMGRKHAGVPREYDFLQSRELRTNSMKEVESMKRIAGMPVWIHKKDSVTAPYFVPAKLSALLH